MGRAERELATVSILAALGGAERRLATHTRAALRHGHAASELLALCEHVALYAGFPRALNALAVIDEALTGTGSPRPAGLLPVRVHDHDTVVARRGDDGPPVVLVHAVGVDWRMWEPVMDRPAVGRRVFAYDFRGHGVAAGAPADTAMSDFGADLVAVLDALGLERAHLVGLSIGGAVAQTAAVSHPGRVASLALLGAPDHPVPEAFESRARAGETDGMGAQIAPTPTRWFTPEALADNGWGVRYARERIPRFDPAD
ncbi:alpha/beta fold hydrolase [Streptomyces sp. NPDC050423]|uniref:alpha/beta fold hydrolase n=1 Tax=Streptomyces sp. NPDC050423 TaxID=3155402 RepID=UPI0034254316